MGKHWWKILIIILMPVLLYMAWMSPVSVQTNLFETIRNLYFHVTMWFSMFILFIISLINSIIYLRNNKIRHDTIANMSAQVALVYGIVGIFTGMVWANHTWGSPWPPDPQLNSAAVTILAYIAYMVLRSSVSDSQKKARIAAVYNIFAFVLMFVLIGIMPRISTSLHPGKDGDPGFGKYDLSANMRPVFYGIIMVWTLVGVWLYMIKCKMKNIEIAIKEG